VSFYIWLRLCRAAEFVAFLFLIVHNIFMPEMPEIETLARQLRRDLIGNRITDVRLSGLPLRRPIASDFPAKMRGRTIKRILRRGKYVIAELNPRAFWILHLGMSGSVLYPSPAVQSKHTHAIIKFSDSTELHYRDPRRFGLLAVYEVEQLSEIPEISCLGKDPLSAGFNEIWLWPVLKESRQQIKPFLLDQRWVAGLGNIYSCEALFLAQIHPTRRCFTMDLQETARLVGAVRTVLRTAIKHNGTSFSDFVGSDGAPGANQNNLMVFQREGKECLRCRAPIVRIRQGNRSSFCCSYCQDLGHAAEKEGG
jgi:formamidopyrimidine-DNA glycosylase